MGTWIVGAIVFALLGFAAYRTFRSRKPGPGCGCGCTGCDKAGNRDCH